MKVIIAGTRSINDYNLVTTEVANSMFYISEVISGTYKGVDLLGERFAQEHGIQITRFKPDWDKYGSRAGPIRNEKMAQYGDALILIWDGKSAGSKNMLNLAKYYGLTIHEKII